MPDLGKVDASSTIYLPFTTHAASGASVAPSSAYEAGDVQLYKAGSATQRSSTAGWTMTSPFDSITGLHLLAIDLSDNTDAGFYAAGSSYFAVLSADTETVDALTVVAVIGTFSIGPVSANMTQILGTAVATPATNGILDVNVKNIDNDAASASGTVTFPNATLASTANITAGTITTVTNLTNAPTAGDLTATMKTSVGTAVAASAVASVTGNVGGNVTGSVGSIPAATLTAGERNSVADALLDRADGVETGITLRQAQRVKLAAMSGKADGAATTTMHYRDPADAKNRITATVDADGNRSAVTLDVS